jgi:hypothetical protein
VNRAEISWRASSSSLRNKGPGTTHSTPNCHFATGAISSTVSRGSPCRPLHSTISSDRVYHTTPTMAERQQTPPRATRSAGKLPANPPTPEQIRKMEIARLKAKAVAQQTQPRPSPAPVAGAKRAYSSVSASNAPTQLRNAAAASPQKRDQNGMIQPPSNDYIQPAKKYA